jgi:hypothetical protein
MKIRSSFVSNSSSSSFIITNRTGDKKTLVDFVLENGAELVEQYNSEYRQEEVLSSVLRDAEDDNIEFKPYSSKRVVFGDEDGTTIGRIFDYILRDGGVSSSFTWRLDEYLR